MNRSAAQIHGMDVLCMVMPEEEDHIQRKLASVIGKGVKVIDLYSYGPAYGGYDHWSESFSQARGVATFVRYLAKTEDVLYPGKPRKPEVAVIHSATDDIWKDHNEGEMVTHASFHNGKYVYLALLHDQVPIDFIDEIEIEKGRLKEYKAAYLSSEYLRTKTQETLVEWVRDGGYLWTDGFSATGDEYGQPSEILLPVLGIKDCKIQKSERRDYSPERGVSTHDRLDTITFNDTGATLDAIGMRVAFSLSDPAATRVLATFTDQSPAIIEHDYGKGKVHYAGTMAGISYRSTVNKKSGRIETDYRDVNRRVITDFPASVGIEKPLTCSVPMVEADLLESEEGIGVVLANYAAEEPLAEVKLSIMAHRVITSVLSAKRGELPFAYDKRTKTVDVTLPLEIVDILVLN